MGYGEYKVAAQSGAKGYFGKVTLEAEPTDNGGEVVVEFDKVHADRWQSGARFGIDYVLEHFDTRKLFPKGGKIHVSTIVGHEVDTTHVLIAYVTTVALFRALGFEPTKRPDLDTEKGMVTFPK